MAIYELDGQAPELPADGSYFVADTAVVIGKVRLKKDASVWFGSVLRGDNELIDLGDRTNIQEGSMLHTDLGYPMSIGADCTIGHHAILHGCTIGPNSLVGMGATVLNGAVIGAGSLIGAGALVTEGKAIPDGVLAVGRPAKVVRALTETEAAGLVRSAANYRANMGRFRVGLRPA